jgi:hypothetical protein
MAAMVQTLLADRFQLKVHRETRELPVFILRSTRSDGRLGANLTPTRMDCDAINRTTTLPPMFDIDVTFTPNTQTTDRAASLDVAIQEQLGLKLEADRAPVDVLVIDSASMPTPDESRHSRTCIAAGSMAPNAYH